MLDHHYQDTVQDSGTFLRLALKQIVRHQLPYNPICYAVWYEYATGRNKALNRAVRTLEEQNIRINYDTILKFFRSHIADELTLKAEKKTAEFKTLLNEVTRHLDTSGSQIRKNGSRVASYSGRLTQTSTVEEVHKISRGILNETTAIIHQSNSLKQEMDETITEVDALKKELEGVKRAAKTDMLTGLLNRRGFDEAMVHTIADVTEKQIPLTIVIADLDHFKRVNDTHGHLVGDNVLRVVAKVLIDNIKGKDIAARFGGEEFILILPETPLKGGSALAEQIRLSLEGMRWINKNTGAPISSLTISLGVAEYQTGETINTLIERADTALYHAKNNGRNRTVTELDIKTA